MGKGKEERGKKKVKMKGEGKVERKCGTGKGEEKGSRIRRKRGVMDDGG